MNTNSPRYDVAIIGGGVFGCSIARLLSSQTDLTICLLEKEYHLAEHQSGRNSGTIHPGLAIHLEPGTRKARFGVEGGPKLREYCYENSLPINDCGMMVVGTTAAEVKQLETVATRTEALGVDVRWLDECEIEDQAPSVQGHQALYTPESATVDGQAITYAFAKEAWQNGVRFYLGHTVQSLKRRKNKINIGTDKGTIVADCVVNAAGSWGLRLAHQLDLADQYHMVGLRGQYYELTLGNNRTFETNVYPTSMPPRIPNSVGVHFTPRPDGKVIVGPTGMLAKGPDTYGRTDVDLGHLRRTVSSPNFWKFLADPNTMRIAWDELNKTYRKPTFVERCRRLVPDIRADELAQSYVGIAPAYVNHQGEVVKESVFVEGARSLHILRPKPGLTAAISIGEYACDRVETILAK